MPKILALLCLLFAITEPVLAVEPQRAAPPRLAPIHSEPPAWFKESFLDLREDVAEATRAGRRLMLYFHQEGCSYCARFLKDNFGQRAIVKKTRRHFDLVAIDTLGAREVTGTDGRVMSEKDFARTMNAAMTPTLLIFDERGDIALRLIGYAEPRKFDLAMDYAIGKMEKKLEFDFYLEERGYYER